MLTILFDGIAYGMLLFVLACGLAVTLGLMNFVNLAHGAFAMAGGYATVVLVNRLGVPVLRRPAARLPVQRRARASCWSARCTCMSIASSHLDQVLFTIGLVFMSVAAVDYVMGSQQVFVQLPQLARRASSTCSASGIGRYRLLIIVICGLLTIALQLIAVAHALRQPAARRSGRRARGARARHQRVNACSR